MEYKCPKCGETKNLHYNLDYTRQNRPVIDVLCNECGEFFGDKKTVVMETIEKRSDHWADVLTWLEKVVNSCKTPQQSRNCELLIANFNRKYEKQLGLGTCYDLTREMSHKLIDLNFEYINKKIRE